MIDFQALFKISYGLYIVSSGDQKDRNGFISNTVFQVTSEPPQFAACCNKENYTAEFIQRFGNFSVSVLGQNTPSEFIGRFGYRSGKQLNKFEGIKQKTGIMETPIILENTLAWLECKLIRTVDVGTHFIFIGELVSSDLVDDQPEPMTYDYYRKVKKGVAPKNAPTYLDKKKLSQQSLPSKAIRYQCPACGYIYDPEKGDPDSGIKPGTPFEALPDDWVCPLCGTEKADFIKLDN